MRNTLVVALAASLLAPSLAMAGEFYVGEPVEKEGMQISPAYLEGIQMDHMPKGSSMDPKAIHLEVDVHAAKGDKHGFPEDAWIPYLTIHYTVEKVGTSWKKTGTLAAMQAKDGPHYANNTTMNGPGQYKLTYVIDPPSENGFIRHVDKETGIPDWWKPVSASWTFTYPSKSKG